MVIYAQSAPRMARQVAHCRVSVHTVVQQTCTKLSGVAEHDLGFGPPAPQNGSGDYPIEVAVRDYRANI